MLQGTLLSKSICKPATQQDYALPFANGLLCTFLIGSTQQGRGGEWGLIDISTLADIGLFGFHEGTSD